MRLNLGCGTTHFPLNQEDIGNYEWRYALPHTVVTESDWINVDKVDLPGVDEVVELFRYPWPWESNSVEEIWASHLIEHIPHDADIISPGRDGKLDKAASIDGWFAWFYEAWRVLKTGCAIHIITPYAFSFDAMVDPTHRRYIIPASFSYFADPDENATFDYGVPFRFAARGDVQMSIPDTARANKYDIFGVNVFKNLSVTLEALKDAD